MSNTAPHSLSPTTVSRIHDAAETLGTNPLLDWVCRLLDGRARHGADGDPDIAVLGGMEAVEDWMGRVWAAQTLLELWHHTATTSVITALNDPAWQVRVIAVEVAGYRDLNEATDTLLDLLDDPTPQVRSQAATALGEIISAENESALKALNSAVTSTDSVMADAAESALNRVAERFDRSDLRPSPRY
ncbi:MULTISPECIES: HEAT repeat domain-containing protein [Auritidibacter]|uniref:HEAT repeat domain-containing protein n=1 Tax=Auritidibacter TaxID=1160973 RepID=UPI000D738462|nr:MULTISPECIES: HEAT repeat domain-containing protein [Auritidibacter]NIH71079.1 hypothetical protein [Auritidibacter ignavus]PXA79266.1 hypothetical protein DCC25_09690 [Auritidibacter sp. NML120636]RMX22407.1 hypothetical protein DYI20_10190 [Auritidibacter ignavus]WHS28843.1 HEAT repeat domain-containing protein [Auritidibacter ignavus]